jgi:GTPase SAR1 family protein
VKQVEKHAAPGVEKILIGNKSDMVDAKVIERERGQEMATENNMDFFETSAMHGTGINDAFELISRKIIKNLSDK